MREEITIKPLDRGYGTILARALKQALVMGGDITPTSFTPNPVQDVEYTVRPNGIAKTIEDLHRVNKEDQIIMAIETNGSITPRDALLKAIGQIEEQLNILKGVV